MSSSSPLINKKEWIPDSERRKCSLCDVKFSFRIRKHHCRFCGEVICNSCSGKKVKREGSPRRICNACFEQAYPSKRSKSNSSAVSDVDQQNQVKVDQRQVKASTMTKTSLLPKLENAAKEKSSSLLEMADDAFQRQKARCMDESIWSLKSSKKGVKRFSPSMCDSGFAGARGIVTIEAGPNFVYESLTDMDKRSQYDNYFDGYENMEQVNDRTYVTRIKTKGSFATAPRDFCVLRQRRDLKPGSVFAGFQTSVQHVRSPPNADKYVRAQLRSFLLVEGIENNLKSRVTVMLDINLAGNLPTWLIRQVITGQLDVLVKQRKWIESQPKKLKWMTTETKKEVKKTVEKKLNEKGLKVISVETIKFWSGERFKCDFNSTSQVLSSKGRTRFEIESCDPAADLEIRLSLSSGNHVLVRMNVGTLLRTTQRLEVPVFYENNVKESSMRVEIVPFTREKKRNKVGFSRKFIMTLSAVVVWILFGLGFVSLRGWRVRPVPPFTLLLVISAGLGLIGRRSKPELSSRCISFEASLIDESCVTTKNKSSVVVVTSSSTKEEKEVVQSSSPPSTPTPSGSELQQQQEKMMTFAKAKVAVKSLSNIDTSNLLRLYGLYKVVTEGPCKGDRPSVWDPRKRAKFDAWSKASQKSKEECERDYVSLVQTLLAN